MSSTPNNSTISVGAIFVGQPISKVDDGNEWVSSIHKTQVLGPVNLDFENIEGDAQADLRVHGGPDKAICVYPASHYERWPDVDGWPQRLTSSGFGPGAFGENLSVVGPIDEHNTSIGDRYKLGTAMVEVSQPRSPCWKLGRRWSFPDLPKLTQDLGLTGWYLRVIETGSFDTGAPLELLDRPFERWTVAETNRVIYDLRDDRDANLELSKCTALSNGWRDKATRRSASNKLDFGSSDQARLSGG